MPPKSGSRPRFEISRVPRLSVEDSGSLEEPFTEKEVWEAVCGCDSDKAPSPDGFNFKYIKRYWDTIKRELVDAVKWFWQKGEFSKGCNASFVTLVPKVDDPLGLGDYRPISLIGSYYKIISKLLAERVKKVIGNVIGEVQNAFIKGRYILDGVLIANETMEFMKKKKQNGIVFKLDFEKADDSIEWGFLMAIMKKMGFGNKWCKWVDSCLRSTSISILVNGSPTREFSMEREVRQGDPLSPFLFILAAEGLNALTKEAVSKSIFKGIRVGEDEVLVSHLQYADDTIIFGECSRENARNLMNILKCYEEVAGLKINLQKSKLYGVGVEREEVERMARYMRCSAGEFPFTYLGLPISVNMRRVVAWNGVIESFKNKLSGWKAKTMSFGGRLTLVKSVLGSLPLYYFSMFRVPSHVISTLERIRKNFFWGGLGEGKKLHWVKWDNVISSFGDGGLNIGSLKVKNLALLGKWWWRFRVEKDALWRKIVKSIYGGDGGWESEGGSRFRGGVWADIIKVGKSLDRLEGDFVNIFYKTVGDGLDTSFWLDKWVGDSRLCDSYPRLFRLERDKEVAVGRMGNWVGENWSWNWDWASHTKGRTNSELSELQSLVENVSLNQTSLDTWRYKLSVNGEFSVKSLSMWIEDRSSSGGSGATQTFWSKIIPRKVNVFIWRVLKRRIPVRVEIDKRDIDLDSVLCPCCDNSVESVDHCMVLCENA
ncbi:putative RNA-directed DNA polymerase [Tanacetum coccineum]